jgi:HTH-type transcriptional regulator/antitoxin MqsA
MFVSITRILPEMATPNPASYSNNSGRGASFAITSQAYKGQVFSSETRGAFCDHCMDGFVEFDAAEENAWLVFRDRVDAEAAADLARIRKKLKLTQAEAAQLAGGGKNAFSRYEHGKAKPVAAVVNLFRLLDHHPELLSEIKNR